MEFGRKLLTKFGWQEGKGLGKLENGMVAPLKPKLKFDAVGIGFDYSKEYVNDWWAQGYNEALNSVKVSKRKKTKNHDDEDEQTKGRKNQKKSKQFIKTETLLQDGSHIPETDIGQPDENNDAKISIDFEHLFEVCGGRTAHKGARHGLGLSGKLARLEAQEKGLKFTVQHTPCFESCELETSDNLTVKRKKRRKKKSECNVIDDANTSSSASGAPFLHQEEAEEQGHLKRRKSKSSKKKEGIIFKYNDEDVVLSDKEKYHRNFSVSEKSNLESETTQIVRKSKKRKKSKPEQCEVSGQDCIDRDLNPVLGNPDFPFESINKKEQGDLTKSMEIASEGLKIDPAENINVKGKKRALFIDSSDQNQELKLVSKSRRKMKKK